jgi:hypothetical protein
MKLVSGMGLLLTGQKLGALALFGSGLKTLEAQWRERHPECETLEERWRQALEFYDKTHQNEINRLLHTAGIPMILGGAIGLLLSSPLSPPWFGSAGFFGLGWLLNIIGHTAFEKNRPAFAEDPLSFIAGPIWDFQRLIERFRSHAALTA